MLKNAQDLKNCTAVAVRGVADYLNRSLDAGSDKDTAVAMLIHSADACEFAIDSQIAREEAELAKSAEMKAAEFKESLPPGFEVTHPAPTPAPEEKEGENLFEMIENDAAGFLRALRAKHPVAFERLTNVNVEELEQ